MHGAGASAASGEHGDAFPISIECDAGMRSITHTCCACVPLLMPHSLVPPCHIPLYICVSPSCSPAALCQSALRMECLRRVAQFSCLDAVGMEALVEDLLASCELRYHAVQGAAGPSS